MRWVILTDDWPPQIGGVATWSWGAARGLAEAGCAVRVFARSRPGLAEPERVRVTGVRGRSFGLWGPWWATLRGAGAIREADAVLATTWPMAEGAARLVGPGTPVHVVFHGSDLTRPDPRRAQVAARASHRWAVSRYLVELAAAEGLHARWIPSPVEIGGAPARRPDGPWAFVGRATALKGGDRFARLVARAGAEGLVIGDGPERPSWERVAAAEGARVRFVGGLERGRVREELARCALVGLLPRADAGGAGAEGLGLALLEGAAVGALPVGTAVGGVPEAVGPGLVLDPEASDAPERIRCALDAWEPEMGAHFVASVHGRARVAAALMSH